MRRDLRLALLITDSLFIAYWTLTALAAAGAIHIPPDYLYRHHDDPRVVAWNWSFFPLDIGFSVVGYVALAAARRGDPAWRAYALISLVLTSVAGLMAVSYWALTGEIDPSWFAINAVLAVWPLFYLPRLVCDLLPGARAA